MLPRQALHTKAIIRPVYVLFPLFCTLFSLFSLKTLANDPPTRINQTTNFNNKNTECLATTGPVSLTYASYYGQSINNLFHDVAIDATGNIYATGSTINQGFDAVVVKFDASGNFLWETFLGGTDAENFNGNDIYDYGKIAVDVAGNVYVTGITQSDNFPMASPFQGTRAGGIDVFVTKLDTDGNLLLSSYLGGTGDENFGGSGGIAVDASGTIYVAGNTTNDGFFSTTSAYQTSFSGGTESDIFVVKIAADFSSVEGTYWGDEATDVVRDLEIASDGTVWAVGYSDQSTLTLGGFQNDAIDVRDGIILGFDNALSALSSSTFYGGRFDDEINSLAIDASGNIHITGSTFSTNDFPTVAPFQGAYIGGEEAFAAKLNPACQLIWSTFIAASQNESGSGIAIDPSGNVYVSGITSSTNFPIERTAQETYNTLTCENDAFIFKFNADGSRDWASYYGGWRTENPYGLVANSSGQVISVGRTESTDIAVTDDAYQAEAFTAGVNAFISIFEIACPSTPIIIHSTENAFYYDQFWCNSYERARSNYFQSDTCTLQLIAPPGYTSYSWTQNGSPVSGATDQIYSVRSPGSANSKPEYRAIIESGNDCVDASTSVGRKINWVRPMCGFGSSFDPNELPHQANIEEGYTDVVVCPSEVINFPLQSDGFCGAEYQWQKDFEDIPNATDPNYTVTGPGCYRVAIINSFTGCKVYSITKRFILLDQVLLNNYYYNQPESCNDQDSIIGCSSVLIKARVPTCERCDDSPRTGLTYTFYNGGILHASNSYGYINTSDPGTYTVEVSNGTCTVSSTSIVVAIRPTEKPILIQPAITPLCLQSQDSFTFILRHPAIGDSALIRYNFNYPASDITTYDSIIKIASTDLGIGCVDVRLTTKEGCSSRTPDIEIHDTLTPLIYVNGSHCIPVQLRSANITGCHLDSIFWYLEDSLVMDRNYDASYTATLPGSYVMRVKNACGDFLSDTVHISGNFVEPAVSPTGPICLPASLSVAAPDSHVVINWYRNTLTSSCNTHPSYLIPNQNDINLIANLPGFYFATFEDTLSGCISICSNRVEVQRSVAGANITPSNDIYFCDGTGISNVTFNVSPASTSFTYQWYRNNNPIAGATSGTYTTNTEGVYRVYLENACDNAFTPVVSIFEVENPEVTINQPDTIYLCGPDTIRLDTNNDQPIIYQWYQNDTLVTDAIDSFFLAIEPGKYEVYGINNNTQCEDWSQEIYIINSTPIVASISSTPACNGPCTGTLRSTVSGGIPSLSGDYSYIWENGSTNANRSSVCVGPYRLTITDAIGCSTILSGTIDTGFTLNSTIDSISCANSDDAEISIATSSGAMPFQFSWNNGDTTNQLTNLGPGIYSLTVTDDQNCSTTFTTILSEPSPLVTSYSLIHNPCQGNTEGAVVINSTTGGIAPYTYFLDSTTIASSNQQLDHLAVGDYILRTVDATGCEVANTLVILEPQLLTIAINLDRGVTCAAGADAIISTQVTGGTPPYNYTWEDASTNDNRTDLSAGIYKVTVTDQQNCSAIDSIQIMDGAPIEFAIGNQKDLTCYGADDGSISINPSGGTLPYSYVYNTTVSSDSILLGLAENSYTVVVVDANNCQSDPQVILINSPDSLSANVTTMATQCFASGNGVAEVIASGGTLPYVYQWSNGHTESQCDTLTTGNYFVTITDDHLCEKVLSFFVDEALPLATQFSVKNNDCNGSDNAAITILSTIGGTSPYTYYLDNNTVPPGSSQDLTNLAAGNYTLRTVDSHNCEISESLVITEPDVLEVDLSINNELTCFGGTDGAINCVASGGTSPYTYLWQDGSTDRNPNNIGSGFFQVTITDAQNCTLTDFITLQEGPFIELNIVAQNDVDCFGAENGSFVLNGVGGTAPYQYFVNSNGSTNGQFENLVPGDYSVYTEDANGCISELQVLTIEQPLLLQANAVTEEVLCFGESNGAANIEVVGGVEDYLYLWNNNSEVSQASDLIAGNYIVTITDRNACTTTVNFTVGSPDPLETSLSSEDNLCFEEEKGKIVLERTTGGTWPYHYFFEEEIWETPETALSFLGADSYEIVTVDAQGCQFYQSIDIKEPPLFSLGLGADIEISFGQNAILDLSISNGRGRPMMRISPNEFIDCQEEILVFDCPSPEVILPMWNMLYTVELTDENGCIATDEIQILLDRTEDGVYLPNIFSPRGSGFNHVFYVQSNATIESVDRFIIMNRWGGKVFEQTDFATNDTDYGWDGLVNGNKASEGVYVWMVEYRTIDGKVEQLTGDVILKW